LFITYFKAQTKVHGWDKDDQITILPALLTDRAAEIFNQLSVRAQRSIDSALEDLREQLSPSRTEWLAKLNNAKPSKNMSTREFTEELAKFYDHAYPNAADEQRTNDLRQQLKKHLPKDKQYLIVLGEEISWNKTVKIVASEVISLNPTDLGESPVKTKTNSISTNNNKTPNNSHKNNSDRNYNRNNNNPRNNNYHNYQNNNYRGSQPQSTNNNQHYPNNNQNNQYQNNRSNNYSNQQNYPQYQQSRFQQSVQQNTVEQLPPLPPSYTQRRPQQVHNQHSNNTNNSNQRDLQAKVCGRCKQPGHFAAICRAAAPASNPPQGNNQ
jgi:hypothetical protein